MWADSRSQEAGAMVRGGSSGGGQSSLGYLFGSDSGPPKAAARAPAAEPQQAPAEQRAAGFARGNAAEEKAAPAAPAAKVEEAKSSVESAPKLGRSSNNYHRADGQNTGNFITDRPSTKVHAAPGGGSSLGYLFGGN
ncbi:hypothetical protein M758_8G133000 [Ceratodon purpureus]|nr:hypothetical protein M758_8G133000 [Ceratodon purpureus]